jgi:hypothetical protein
MSWVQAFPSLHTTGVPATHPEPASQLSMPLQAFPSLQAPSSGVWMHCPVPGSQLSCVQVMPSSQTTGSYSQPAIGSQPSIVQASPSSQSTGLEMQPRTGSQEVVVHASPSSQSASSSHAAPGPDSAAVAVPVSSVRAGTARGTASRVADGIAGHGVRRRLAVAGVGRRTRLTHAGRRDRLVAKWIARPAGTSERAHEHGREQPRDLRLSHLYASCQRVWPGIRE